MDHNYKCLICLDKGFIIYDRKIEDRMYQYVCHCICSNADDFKYDGSKCNRRKSSYFIQTVEKEFDTRELIKDNVSRLYDVYGKEKVNEVLKNLG